MGEGFLHKNRGGSESFPGFECSLLYFLVSTGAVVVKLAVRTLLCGPLKFKVGFVAKLFCDLSPGFLNFYSK